MKHPFHTLLPVHMQKVLMDAAATERIEFIDSTVRELHAEAPHKFHDEHSVSLRRFYNEPRQLVPSAGCVIPYPMNRPRD